MLILRKKFLYDMITKSVPEITNHKFLIEEIICCCTLFFGFVSIVIGQ